MHPFQNSPIDLDHDLILSKFESMLGIVSTQGYDGQERKACIDLFLYYTSSHFKREEAIMQGVGYPGCDEHTLAHAYLQNEFHQLLRTMGKDRPNLRSDLEIFRQLFLTHILTHDEAFGEWLNQA